MIGFGEWVIWLGLFIIFLVAEAVTVGLATIWFAGGALAALIISLFTDNFLIQVFVFIIVSIILLWAVRPFALKYMKPRKTETNYKETIGKSARVIEKIDNNMESGRVVSGGQEWMARSSVDRVTIETNSMVKILEIKGVKAIVEPVKEEDEQ
ncbi:MAG: NfeD family protein [Lachnospiraceae bacterium]|nr:NfeD family protein [Lachnospiraceae bacterium]